MSEALSLDLVSAPCGPSMALGVALEELKKRPRSVARLSVDAGTIGVASRAVKALPAAGVSRVVLVLSATDHADDDTEVHDEGALAPTLRRLTREGGPVEVLAELSTGRRYVLPPPSVDISTNDLCGLACVMCSNRATARDPATISEARVRELIDEAAAWGVGRVALTGAGEPFRDAALLSHIEHANSRGLLATVTTNGFPVGERVAARLAAAKVSVSVSIHGDEAATHDAIVGVPTSAEHAWRAVSRLVSARDRAAQPGLSINISTVLQRNNIGEIAALVRRGIEAGVDGHNVQPINLQRGAMRAGDIVRRDDVALMASLWPTRAQAGDLDALFAELLAIAAERPRHLHASPERLSLMRRYLDDPSRAALGVTCRVGDTFIGVDHRGEIRPCYRVPWAAGHASPGRLRRLWSSRAYDRIRQQVERCPLTCLNNCFSRRPLGDPR